MTQEEQSMIRRQQVTDFRASGQTAAVWCSENNLQISTLRYWLNKCNREAKTKGNLNPKTLLSKKQRRPRNTSKNQTELWRNVTGRTGCALQKTGSGHC